jgi:hypothetical protein
MGLEGKYGDYRPEGGRLITDNYDGLTGNTYCDFDRILMTNKTYFGCPCSTSNYSSDKDESVVIRRIRRCNMRAIRGPAERWPSVLFMHNEALYSVHTSNGEKKCFPVNPRKVFSPQPLHPNPLYAI